MWQTTAQYAFYYIAVAMLTGAFGGILNSTQSFLGVIFAHFIYGNADRMTPAKRWAVLWALPECLSVLLVTTAAAAAGACSV